MTQAKNSRWWLVVLLLVAVLIAPFLIWGELFEAGGSTLDWLKNQGRWAWLAGIALLVADILLPVPGTVVMSALGYLYGSWLGGLIAAAGSTLSGVIAYAACRFAGRGAARWIAGEESLTRGEEWFSSSTAGWLVALSRWTPVLPEAVACLAGLARMPFARFFASLLCGCVPPGFAFAAIGQLGKFDARMALLLSAVVPLLLYGLAARLLKK